MQCPSLHCRFRACRVLVGLLVVSLPALVAGCRPVERAASAPVSAPVSAPASASPAVSVSAGKASDRATVKQEADGRAMVEITSTSGIGSATIAWPTGSHAGSEAGAGAGSGAGEGAGLVLVLHTKGLEELRLQAGEVEVIASVGSSPPNAVRQSLRRAAGAQPQPIDEGSPYWIAIDWPQPTSGAGAAIPLQEGAFTIVAPPELLRTAQGSLDVHWIDFYR